MGWPQIVYICMLTAGLVVSTLRHGEPQGHYDARVTFVSITIQIGLLYAGGFFK